MELICAVLAFICSVELAPKIEFTATDRYIVTRPSLVRPQLHTPPKNKSAYWPSDCRVEPPAEYRNIFRRAALKYPRGLTVCELAAQTKKESDFRVDAVSPAGAIGISQFMPATAAEYGLDPLDPVASIYAQARYVDYGIRFFSAEYEGRTEEERKLLAIALYNYGPGNMKREQEEHGYTIYTGDAELWMPAETRNYVIFIQEWSRPK